MGLEFDAISKGAGKEPDNPGHKHTHDSRFIQLTPTVFISHKELLSYRSSSTSFSDLLKTIGPEIITDGLVNWLATKNNTRSHELISADCYLALSKLLSNYDPKSGLSFLAYSKNLLYSKVVDIWREESNSSKAG
jgi:hypothetical protein